MMISFCDALENSDDLLGFERAVALEVSEFWSAPDFVIQYLKHGDNTLLDKCYSYLKHAEQKADISNRGRRFKYICSPAIRVARMTCYDATSDCITPYRVFAVIYEAVNAAKIMLGYDKRDEYLIRWNSELLCMTGQGDK